MGVGGDEGAGRVKVPGSLQPVETYRALVRGFILRSSDEDGVATIAVLVDDTEDSDELTVRVAEPSTVASAVR